MIAEDCSTDNTLEICTRYKELYPDVITLVAHEKNRVTTEFHVGSRTLPMNTSQFCDGDDYWIDRKKLQRMTDFMDKHPDFAICFHRVNYYEEDGSKKFIKRWTKQITDIKTLPEELHNNSSSLFRRVTTHKCPNGLVRLTYVIMPCMLNAQHGKDILFQTSHGSIPQTQQRNMGREIPIKS